MVRIEISCLCWIVHWEIAYILTKARYYIYFKAEQGHELQNVRPMLAGSIPTLGKQYLIFSFSGSSAALNSANQHAILKTLRIRRKMGNGVS